MIDKLVAHGNEEVKLKKKSMLVCYVHALCLFHAFRSKGGGVFIEIFICNLIIYTLKQFQMPRTLTNKYFFPEHNNYHLGKKKKLVLLSSYALYAEFRRRTSIFCCVKIK